MADDDKSKGLDSRTQIILAVVGLIGTVCVALFTNWDKLSASNKSASPTPSSTSSTQPSTIASDSINTSVSLPIGEWEINGNGYKGTLKILAIDRNGNVQGSVFDNPITGFWDEDAQKIAFIRIIDSKDPSTLQFHTGYMFSTKEGAGKLYTLTGSFEGFSGTGAKAQRTTYGWYAQIKQ
jgi:FlaG/FlaF family flagellin (archaellin)